MPDLTQPPTVAEFVAAGASHEQGEALLADYNARTGRGTAVSLPVISPVPAAALPVAAPVPEAQARFDQIMADRAAGKISDYEWSSKYQKETMRLADHLANGVANAGVQSDLDTFYAPAPNTWDYSIPHSAEPLSDEAMAANSTFTQMLHAQRTPVKFGNAIMKDLAAGRPTDKTAEVSATLRPWISSMLSAAQSDPRTAPYVEGMSPDLLLAMLSPETVISLIPWIQYRAGRR